jgi:hypothetical protein
VFVFQGRIGKSAVKVVAEKYDKARFGALAKLHKRWVTALTDQHAIDAFFERTRTQRNHQVASACVPHRTVRLLAITHTRACTPETTARRILIVPLHCRTGKTWRSTPTATPTPAATH